MQCVACGKNEAKIGALCEQCYISKHNDLIHQRNKLIRSCRSCGRIKYGSTWIDREDPRVAEMIGRIFTSAYGPMKCAISDIEYDYMTVKFNMNGVIRLPEGEVHLKQEKQIKLEKTLCPHCRSKHSENYGMRIQLRGSYTPKQYATIMEKIIKYQDHEKAAVKITREKGLVNIDVDTIKNGDDIVQEILGMVDNREVIESYQLRGTYRDGRRKYHKTTLIRIKDLRPGMLFLVGARKIVIEKVVGNKVHFSVEGEGKYVMKQSEFEKLVGL